MPATALPLGVTRFEQGDTEVLQYRVDPTVYTLGALFRACYLFTDRCYLFLQPADNGSIQVQFRGRSLETDLVQVAGAFANELINQRIRADLAEETRAIREMIVARAFGDLSSDAPER